METHKGMFEDIYYMAKLWGKFPTEVMKQSQLDYILNKLIYREFVNDDLKFQAAIAGAKIR